MINKNELIVQNGISVSEGTCKFYLNETQCLRKCQNLKPIFSLIFFDIYSKLKMSYILKYKRKFHQKGIVRCTLSAQGCSFLIKKINL